MIWCFDLVEIALKFWGGVVHVMLGIQFAMKLYIYVQSINSACDLYVHLTMLRILIWQNLTSLLFILITPNL